MKYSISLIIKDLDLEQKEKILNLVKETTKQLESHKANFTLAEGHYLPKGVKKEPHPTDVN